MVASFGYPFSIRCLTNASYPMGLRFDLAKASRPSKSRIEVKAYNLVYQKLPLQSIFSGGPQAGRQLRTAYPAP